MAYLTWGSLHVTAKRVATHVTLDALRGAMAKNQYANDPPTRGWAGVQWRREMEEQPRHDRDVPLLPAIEDLGEYRVLLGRVFDDRVNRVLYKSLGHAFDDFPARNRFDVQAVDVAIIENETGLSIFVASHDPQEVGLVLNQLRTAARTAGVADDADWQISQLPKIDPQSDLYLWMLHRWDAVGGTLSPTLKVVEFNSLSTRDMQSHVTRSLRGIDLSRVDTLGAAAEGQELGPAKFVLLDSQVGLRCDLFLLKDGAFDIHREGTEYASIVLDKALLGIYATLDVATRVLPRLHNAYKNDANWPRSVRATFVADCRKELAKRFK